MHGHIKMNIKRYVCTLTHAHTYTYIYVCTVLVRTYVPFDVRRYPCFHPI